MTSAATVSDAQLVERCRAGDAGAWAELVERYSRYVYAIVVQGFRLRDQDAEDVFQDVFTKAYENIGRLRDGSAVRPWLAQLTRNACIDRLRTGSREQPSDDEELDLPELDRTLERLDDALSVRGALERLSDDCREILDRFFARDESYRTIGGALGLPSGTIASRISRCLDKLRDEFDGKKARGCAVWTSVTHANPDPQLEQLVAFLDSVSRRSPGPLSGPAPARRERPATKRRTTLHTGSFPAREERRRLPRLDDW